MQANLSLNPSPSFRLIPLLLLALLALVLFASLLPVLVAQPARVAAEDLSESHGITRHGANAEAMRQCLADKGPLDEWINPATGRVANICQLGETTFGIQIVEQRDGQWKEVTAYIKNKMTRLEQVLQYLKNAGYQPLH